MAYADQTEMSTGRMVSIGLVVLLHIGVGYALVTGLAYDAAKQVFEDTKTFEVEEEKPEEPEEPPPPPEKLDIPPPPKVQIPPPVNPTPVFTNPIVVDTRPVVQPQITVPTPPPPPAPPAVATKAVQRSGSISDEDYPPSAQRNEESGTTVARFTIGTDGRVTSCDASGASPALDAETCKLIIRRFRYKPAKDAAGNAIAETKSQRVTWRLPK